ncbi:GIY-YIG nuclease family protein [Reyranella soli]|uniref:Nuclease n=1 Tax=Reyranella soli TaxID=1230389 RepID=A0A512NG70_9HYPH|nr:GIY-YIG nuclease family protein [Reyranella soli]GEP57946.1 nuclease [Reyranella soli]
MSERRYFVYIMMTSNSLNTMYIGVTNDIGRRVFEHRNRKGSEFAAKYRVTRLVYVEEFENPTEAIAREKQLKGWKRIRKNQLVRAANPTWADLAPESS